MQSNAILSEFHSGQYTSGDIGQTIGNSNDAFIPVTQAMRDGADIYFKITVEGDKNATSTNSGDNARIHIKGAQLLG